VNIQLTALNDQRHFG